MSVTTVTPKRRDWRRLTVYLVSLVVIVGFLALLLWRYIFITILPGHTGVLYRLLGEGTVIERIYTEGLNLKLPWNRFYLFETRVQAKDFDVQSLSREGMVVTAHVTVLFQLERDQVGHLLQQIGPNYIDRIVRPLTIGAVRETVAQHDSHELYTVEAIKFQRNLMERLVQSDYHTLIKFREVLLRRIELPNQVIKAIEQKLTQEQLTASYTFRLKREQLEAERRRIEAIGIENYYSIISDALTEQLLTWRGIEATVQLAQSPNSKIVIVGGGRDQLPLILGSDIFKDVGPPPKVEALPSTTHPLPDWERLPGIFGPLPELPQVDVPPGQQSMESGGLRQPEKDGMVPKGAKGEEAAGTPETSGSKKTPLQDGLTPPGAEVTGGASR